MSIAIDVNINFNVSVSANLGDHPFVDFANLRVVCDFYKLKLLGIDLVSDNEVDWTGLFFINSTGTRLHIFSGGRFGYAGFLPVSAKTPISTYLPLLGEKLKDAGAASCSLAGSYMLRTDQGPFCDSWSIYEICYLIATTHDVIDSTGLKLKKSKIRSSLSRSLKKATDLGFRCRVTQSLNCLQEWYKHCHLVRMDEISGKKWDFDLLLNFIKSGTASLVVVEDRSRSVVGGCVFLESRRVLELFMMSTPAVHQENGANYILTETLYSRALEMGMEYINWQASNPPVGSLVDYKKKWDAHEKKFLIYNLLLDASVTKHSLIEEFPDFFIFPYTKLDMPSEGGSCS
jgi:hypothetical protein